MFDVVPERIMIDPGCRHTPIGGAANIEGGVTIDMQSMNQVVVSSDLKKVGIGSGNRWGNIYPTLDNLNVAMVGGRLSPVGAGGLIIGGLCHFTITKALS